MKQFSRIVSGIAVVMLGLGVLLCFLGIQKQDWGRLREAYAYDGKYETTAEQAKEICMEIPYGYVRIGITQGTQILFSAVNIENGSVKTEADSSLFYVSSDCGKDDQKILGTLVSHNMLTGKEQAEDITIPVYTLLIPEGDYKVIDINVECGGIELDQITADRLNIKINMGEIKTSGISAERARFECNIGTVDAGGDFTEIEGNVNMGTLALSLAGGEKEYSSDITCSIGSIQYGSRGYDGGIGQECRRSGSTEHKKMLLICDIGSITVAFGQESGQ